MVVFVVRVISAVGGLYKDQPQVDYKNKECGYSYVGLVRDVWVVRAGRAVRVV